MAVTIFGNGQVIVQVISTTLTSAFTTSSTSWTNWTGLTATITPKSASNKIYVLLNSECSASGANVWDFVKVQRNGTDMVLGDAVGGATRAWLDGSQGNTTINTTLARNISGQYLDSPATTSAVTYQAQVIMGPAGGSAAFGRTWDTSDGNRSSVPSTITLMEIAYA
jgi:hypothetical protein